jgi:hypothetical protein
MFNDPETMDNGERGAAEGASHATQCFCDVSGWFLTTIQEERRAATTGRPCMTAVACCVPSVYEDGWASKVAGRLNKKRRWQAIYIGEG